MADGIVHTVRGPVSAGDLGVVLPHEHVLVDLRRFFEESANEEERVVAHAPVTIENLAWVRFHHHQCLDELHLSDVASQCRELARFKAAGGGSIVDLTPACAGRDVAGLSTIAEATGLHVVAASGVYLDQFHSDNVRKLRSEQIGELLASEIEEGIGDTGIRAGIIGEMGCSWPLTPGEEKALKGAVLAQLRTGASISIHPGRHPDAPRQLLNLLITAGARLDRVVICHLDRTVTDHAELLRIAAQGCFLEFDLFGQESSYVRYGPVDLPNDAIRISRIARLFDDGLGEQILISQDIAVKHWLTSYGGHGYQHILERVVPRMEEHGFTEEAIGLMLVANPARMLALRPS